MYVDTSIKVRYGETDMMGVVYHANYLLYLEDARADFLNAVGFSYNEQFEQTGYMCPVHALEIQYNGPLHYGESGFVRTSVSKNLHMKTVYHQQVYRDGMDPSTDTPLVDAFVTACTVERSTFKPINLKRAFPELYAKYNEVLESVEK